MIEVFQEWFSPEFWASLGGRAFRLFIILTAAMILRRMISGLIPKLQVRAVNSMRKNAGGREADLEKRATTLAGIISGGLVAVVWVLAGILALREVGFDITPILAGAGVIGLAVSFGAQNLVRDVITGMVMLIENQIRVGDVVSLGGTSGAVERINLRTTVLRDLSGTVHIIPNGEITRVSNMTRDFSFYVFDVGVAYKENTDRVVAALQEVSAELQQEPDFKDAILEPLAVLGVDQFADSSVVIKTRIKTMPSEQWRVGREMNRRIKMRFDNDGIEIPFPHRTLTFTPASPPFQIDVQGQGSADGRPAPQA